MANEPITLQLTATSALTGNGSIALTRSTLQASATGRFFSASIPSGSRVSSDIFGLFSSDSVKAITITATTHCPTDVARVVVGAVPRIEKQLAASSTMLLAPGEQLAFVTKGAVVLTLTVNELAETEQATWASNTSAPLSRVRVLKTDGAGYSPTGVANISLSWNSTERLFTASGVGGGSFDLATLVPQEFRYQGVFARVRASGFDGETASVGYAEAVTGDPFFVADVLNGQWSPRFVVSHDDRIAISSPSLRPGVGAIVADIELVPASALGDACRSSCSTETGTSTTSGIAPGGLVSQNEWENFSVNAAGASQTNGGWEMWTHAQSTNPAGGFGGGQTGNKSILATGVFDGWRLSQLTAIEIRYACRSAGVSSLLNHPYVNVLIDVNGDGSLYKIGVIDRTNNPSTNLLNQVSVGATPEAHEYTLTWVGGGRIKIVNLIAGVTPVVDVGATWHSKVYTIDDIVAQYPNATIVRAYPNDSGLPANQELPGFWLNLGDSAYTENSRVLIRGVRING